MTIHPPARCGDLAGQLIRSTARQQWRLLAVNLGSSVVEALSEGGTLAVVFLAVEVLAAPEHSRFNWSTHPLLGLWPEAASWLNTLPAGAVYQPAGARGAAAGAAEPQPLGQHHERGYFAAECRAGVTARIHSQVLSLSFACASGTKVGDLTVDASQGPKAIRIQIEQSGQLLLVLAVALVGAALRDWGEP